MPNHTTAHEAAEALGVNYLTLLRWLREGELKGWKVGNVWRVDADALARLVEYRETGRMPEEER